MDDEREFWKSIFLNGKYIVWYLQLLLKKNDLNDFYIFKFRTKIIFGFSISIFKIFMGFYLLK